MTQPTDKRTPDDSDATLIVNPFKLATWGQPCIMVDPDTKARREVIKGSAIYKLYRDHGYTEEVKKS